MRRLGLSCVLVTLCACNNHATDAVSYHEIIASPHNKWIHWGETKAVDVTEPMEKSNHTCPPPAYE